MASTPQPAGQRAPHSTARQNINRFWQRVTEGLELSQLWSQFAKDARASYQLYSRDLRPGAATEVAPPKHPYWDKTKQLFWAILEKLSPARRVLLLIALVLLLFPSGGFTYKDTAGDVHVAEFDLHVYGGLLLFVLLILEVGDRVVMKRDLEIAKEIQTWLLPGAAPQVPGLQIAYTTRPANTVAGDYYDVFPRPGKTLEEDRLLLAVADVAGKSIPAAMLMATLQASLKTLSTTGCSLPELVSGMNTYACTNSSGGLRFTTAFLAEYDPLKRTLTYINAGHNAPMLRRSCGAIERLEAGGLPLGIRLDTSYQSGTTSLGLGDWLVIFTDGLIEAVNARGEDYGEPRLQMVMGGGVTGTPAEMLQRIMSELDIFVGNTPQHDDVTCLLVKGV
jgi:phosphoserine phosphatase RsbU/P